jgi:hypothetical protein
MLFELDGDWHQDLSSYLDACVSSVESTLSRIYYCARHRSRDMGWALDVKRYPSARTIPRDARMFAWLSELVQSKVTDRHREYPMFERLREVRHHLHHFDPPAFAMTIEDVAEWLNLGRCAAGLALTIRDAVRVPPSAPLIETLLACEVVFVPRCHSIPRHPQQKNVGYASCRAERALAPAPATSEDASAIQVRWTPTPSKAGR